MNFLMMTLGLIFLIEIILFLLWIQLKKDDFSIELDNNVLVISSEVSNNVSNENLRLNEFNYSSFQRSFKVPESVNLDKIKANYKNGILKILMPKKKDSISKSNRVITVG